MFFSQPSLAATHQYFLMGRGLQGIPRPVTNMDQTHKNPYVSRLQVAPTSFLHSVNANEFPWGHEDSSAKENNHRKPTKQSALYLHERLKSTYVPLQNRDRSQVPGSAHPNSTENKKPGSNAEKLPRAPPRMADAEKSKPQPDSPPPGMSHLSPLPVSQITDCFMSLFTIPFC